MKVERVNRSGNSCNFCNKGKLDESSHANLVYPYTHVTMFSNEGGGGLMAAICDDCLDELIAKSKMIQL